MPAVLDQLGNLEHYYTQSMTEMFKAFGHIRKASLFMGALGCGLEYDKHSQDLGEVLQMATTSVTAARAEFARGLRRGAWSHVFDLMEFQKWLDTKQTDELLRDVRQNSSIPFTAVNIKGTLENVIAQRRRLFEQSAWNVFEALTRHAKGNTNGAGTSGDGRSGWKTNDSYKVNERLVFPYGCTYAYGSFSTWSAYRDAGALYMDLDRVLSILDGRPFEKILTVRGALEAAWKEDAHHPGTCDSTYFTARYFKKGTVHLKWKRNDLLEKFNITAAAGRRWLGEDTQTPRGAAAPTPESVGMAVRS